MKQSFNRAQARFQLSRPVLFALLVGIVCLAGFIALAEDTGEHGVLVQFDTALEDHLHVVVTAQIASVYEFISLFGSEVIVIGTVILGIYLILKRCWWLFAHWMLAIPGGYLLNFLLKLAYNRPRPPYANVFVQQFDSSFPSGHAMMSLIFYGLIAYTLFAAVKNLRARIVLIFIAVLVIVLVGISRLYLGVHYPSDVIAGYLAGGFWLTICITVMNRIRARRKPDSNFINSSARDMAEKTVSR